jgi:hypothetical protein
MVQNLVDFYITLHYSQKGVPPLGTTSMGQPVANTPLFTTDAIDLEKSLLGNTILVMNYILN